jgi:dihydroorotate dehydrogenase (fumarate)
MADLSTKYLGLTIRNPLVIGSSGLTNSVEDITKLEQYGAGAIVLKSIFEEQIMLEADYRLKKAEEDGLLYTEYSETLDYIDVHIKEKELGSYLQLIRDTKKKTMIPIIASINAISGLEWISFARQIEEAGADALELNIFVMPFNFEKTCQDNEMTYYSVLKKIKAIVNIPVSVKISPYFANLGSVIMKMEEFGADGVVMFNRFSSPDIDVNNLKITAADRLSTPYEMSNTLRWVAIMAKRVKMDLAASTGIHDGEAVVKQLLAGATVAQVTSAIYKNGPEYIPELINYLNDWMDEKGFNLVEQFRGKLSQSETQNPEVFERMQFMRYFSEIK